MSQGLEAKYRRPDLKASGARTLNPLGELFVLLLIVVVIVGAVSHEMLISAVVALEFVVAMSSLVFAALSI